MIFASLCNLDNFVDFKLKHCAARIFLCLFAAMFIPIPDPQTKIPMLFLLANKNNIGILVCGSGMGMNIAANRHKNIRAAQCFNLKSTKLSRLHNDANIITLGLM